MITPNDIETKVFSSSIKGYNRREVDEFLDQIMIDYQALLDQNAKMLERVHVLQKQVTEAKDPANMTKDAKHLMNDISASAEQKAEVIIKNAQREAANIVKNAKDSTSQADEDAERLRQKVEKFKLRFKQLLEDEMARVDDTSEDLLDDLRKDFYPAFLYGDKEPEYTKVVQDTDEDIIAELPDVEPEDDDETDGQGENEIFSEEPEESAEPEALAEDEAADETVEEAEEETERDEEEPAEESAEEPTEEPEVEVTIYESEEPEEDDDDEEEKSEEDEEEAEEASEEIETEETPEEPAEESIDDPLLARAKEEDVDVDDLPGFRSSASSMEDTIVIKKIRHDNTVELGQDELTKEQSFGEQTAEKAKELKDSAQKIVSGLFKKEK